MGEGVGRVVWLGGCCLQGHLSTKSQKGSHVYNELPGSSRRAPSSHQKKKSKRHLTDKMQFLCDVTGLDSRSRLNSGWQL